MGMLNHSHSSLALYRPQMLFPLQDLVHVERHLRHIPTDLNS